jgi:hypothetical protein
MSGVHFTLAVHAMALPALDMIAWQGTREVSSDHRAAPDGRAVDPCQRSPA